MLNKGVSNNPFDDTRIGLGQNGLNISAALDSANRLGIDLPNEKGGLVPSPAYYDRAYGGRPWKFSNIYSIAIGEGENMVVPLANGKFCRDDREQRVLYHTTSGKSHWGSRKPLPQYSDKALYDY